MVPKLFFSFNLESEKLNFLLFVKNEKWNLFEEEESSQIVYSGHAGHTGHAWHGREEHAGH